MIKTSKCFVMKDARPVYNPESNMKLASGFAPVSRMLREGDMRRASGRIGCASIQQSGYVSGDGYSSKT
jgi:cytosine/adenosine deaminase-related metal-dependent hydrolase